FYSSELFIFFKEIFSGLVSRRQPFLFQLENKKVWRLGKNLEVCYFQEKGISPGITAAGMMSTPVFSSEASIASFIGISLCWMKRSIENNAANAGQS
ncbi:hypothetical protein, partial [Weizmannia sp. CD-2023]|uniref:hypothetical protein n=1 Tax=Weizmannia sp. CD-2023 TaxID=3037263 RepID=UPI002E20E259|nr:hypothetical protein [Weizmannia sp. CD-2023]